MNFSKVLVVLVLIAALCFSVADARKAKRRVGGCRIFRTRKGRVVKQCRLSRTRVSRRVCTVIRRVGRRATVCCRGGKRVVKRVVRRRRTIRRRRNNRRRTIRRRRNNRRRRTTRRRRNNRRRNNRRRRTTRRRRNNRRRTTRRRRNNKRRTPFRGPTKCATGFVLRFKKLGARRWRRRCVRAKVQTAPAQVCHTWGDPHFKTLDGKTYDNYQQGDFDFARSDDGIFAIQVRQGYAQAWGKNAVNQRVAIKVNGIDIISLNVRKGLIKRNHKKFNLAVNKVVNFKNGGAIKRIGTHRFEVVTPTGIRTLVDWVIVNDKSYYANIYTYATADWQSRLKGFCTTKTVTKVRKSLFVKKFHKRRVPKTRKWTRRLRVRAGRFCRKFRGAFKKECMRDYRVGGRKLAGAAKQVAGDVRRIKKRRSWIRRAARAIGRSFRRL